jgi:hypothetical protein
LYGEGVTKTAVRPGHVSDWGYSVQFRTADGRAINLWRYERMPEVWPAYDHEHEAKSAIGNAIDDYDVVLQALERGNHSRTNDGMPLNWRVLYVMRTYRPWLEAALAGAP